jgi:hypothetical protein
VLLGAGHPDVSDDVVDSAAAAPNVLGYRHVTFRGIV